MPQLMNEVLNENASLQQVGAGSIASDNHYEAMQQATTKAMNLQVTTPSSSAQADDFRIIF